MPSSLPPLSAIRTLAKRMRPSAFEAAVFRRGVIAWSGGDCDRGAPHAASAAETAAAEIFNACRRETTGIPTPRPPPSKEEVTRRNAVPYLKRLAPPSLLPLPFREG